MRAIESLPSGRFKVRFRLGGKQTSRTFDTKRDAQQFAVWLDVVGSTEALDRTHTSGHMVGEAPSMDMVAADHFNLLTGVTDGTRLKYRRLWERTWSRHFGDLPADRLTPDEIRRAFIALSAVYSAKSLQNQRGLLAGVCNRAVELRHLPTNPVDGLRVPRAMEHERQDMRIVTLTEFEDLHERLPEHWRPLVLFLYTTGCRWGEAVALQCGDVNPPLVRIRRALKYTGDGTRQIGPTKTVRSNRTIMLEQPITDLLDLDRPGEALVFTAPRGGPVLHRTFWSRVWLPAVGDMRPRPRIHDLRHSHASNLLAARVPIHEVSARLGHEDIKTTVNTYGHLLPDAQMRAAQAASIGLPAAVLGSRPPVLGP